MKEKKVGYTYWYEYIETNGKRKRAERGTVFATKQEAQKELNYDMNFLEGRGCTKVNGKVVEVEL